MVTTIVIAGREWTLSQRIGRGAFGEVYVASSQGTEAVIKLARKDLGAWRELRIAEEIQGLPNIFPVWATDETEDHFAILMPRAQMSLREHMPPELSFGQAAALCILQDIATGLDALVGGTGKGKAADGIVHRDLKPENIFLFNGSWHIADFGIARYREAGTGPETRQFHKTPVYAAPEQWRGDTATSKTDIYAFGVIAYELLTGHPPFRGHDVGRHHLESPVPPMRQGIAPPLMAIVYRCLYKQPSGRPTAAQVLAQLQAQASSSDKAGSAALQAANLAEIRRRAEEELLRKAAAEKAKRRAGLPRIAIEEGGVISFELQKSILRDATEATLEKTSGAQWSIRLGQAKLEFSGPTERQPDLSISLSQPTLDVIAYAEIKVSMGPDTRAYRGRSHSLWYCNAAGADTYCWLETAFIGSTDGPLGFAPFSSDPNDHKAISAFRATRGRYGNYRVAEGPKPIDLENLHDFINRWAGWLAEASQGKLTPPPTALAQPSKSSAATRPPAAASRGNTTPQPTFTRHYRSRWRYRSTWMVTVIIAAVVGVLIWAGDYFYHYSDPKPGDPGIVITRGKAQKSSGAQSASPSAANAAASSPPGLPGGVTLRCGWTQDSGSPTNYAPCTSIGGLRSRNHLVRARFTFENLTLASWYKLHAADGGGNWHIELRMNGDTYVTADLQESNEDSLYQDQSTGQLAGGNPSAFLYFDAIVDPPQAVTVALVCADHPDLSQTYPLTLR